METHGCSRPTLSLTSWLTFKPPTSPRSLVSWFWNGNIVHLKGLLWGLDDTDANSWCVLIERGAGTVCCDSVIQQWAQEQVINRIHRGYLFLSGWVKEGVPEEVGSKRGRTTTRRETGEECSSWREQGQEGFLKYEAFNYIHSGCTQTTSQRLARKRCRNQIRAL